MKKLIVFLAAHATFKRGQQVSLDAAEADRLVKEGKAIEVTERDQTVEQRDPPGDTDVVAKAVAKVLAPVMEKVEGLEKRLNDANALPKRGAKSTNYMGDVVTDTAEPAAEEPAAATVTPTRELVRELVQELRSSPGVEYRGEIVADARGLRLGRYIRASAAAQNAKIAVEDVLRAWGHKADAQVVVEHRKAVLNGFGVQKANQMGQSVFADGGALVPEQFSAELIPLLRNKVVVRRAGARVLTMSGGNLTLPKQTGASSASYIGENQADSLSKPQLGNIKLSEKTMRVGVVLSNSLLQNAALSADAWVRDDMVQVAGIKEDKQALFGVGSAYSPAGVDALIDTGLKYDTTASDRTAPTAAEVAKDLNLMIRKVKESNVVGPTSRLAHIMNARMEAFYKSVVTSTGAFVYMDEMNGGMLRGYPYFVTEQIANNLAGFGGGHTSETDDTSHFFGDWDTFLIAETEGGMEVKVFPDGTYEDGGTVYSGASRDQTYVRLKLKHDMNMRYTNTIVELRCRPA